MSSVLSPLCTRNTTLRTLACVIRSIRGHDALFRSASSVEHKIANAHRPTLKASPTTTAKGDSAGPSGVDEGTRAAIRCCRATWGGKPRAVGRLQPFYESKDGIPWLRLLLRCPPPPSLLSMANGALVDWTGRQSEQWRAMRSEQRSTHGCEPLEAQRERISGGTGIGRGARAVWLIDGGPVLVSCLRSQGPPSLASLFLRHPPVCLVYLLAAL
jgi:hypothetical protein